MKALLNWRVWAAIGLAVVLAITHNKAYQSGKGSVQTAWDAEKVTQLTAAKEAEIENRRIESARQRNVIDAQSAAVQRSVGLQADAGRARSELDSLRNAITTATADLPSRAPDAVRGYAIDAAELLIVCSRRHQELAAEADAIWSERQTLIEAWPKN